MLPFLGCFISIETFEITVVWTFFQVYQHWTLTTNENIHSEATQHYVLQRKKI